MSRLLYTSMPYCIFMVQSARCMDYLKPKPSENTPTITAFIPSAQSSHSEQKTPYLAILVLFARPLIQPRKHTHTPHRYNYNTPTNTTLRSSTQSRLDNYTQATPNTHQETGLYYYKYRYYDPVTGRWLSRDPIGERGGWNFYKFVDNKPVQNIDILGLKPIGFGQVKKSCYDRCRKGVVGSLQLVLDQFSLNLRNKTKLTLYTKNKCGSLFGRERTICLRKHQIKKKAKIAGLLAASRIAYTTAAQAEELGCWHKCKCLTPLTLFGGCCDDEATRNVDITGDTNFAELMAFSLQEVYAMLESEVLGF